MRRTGAPAAALGVGLLLIAPPAEAAIVRGLQEVIAGVLEVPLSTLVGTFTGPPVLGTVFGAVTGIIHGVGLVAHGALEFAASGVSIAKTVGPYLLPFAF
jgi:hypothetical protein